MREIMTIQIGSNANYVGSHWLNIQEGGLSYNPKFVPDINSNLLFREGVTLEGEFTYTPRVLLMDIEGSLGYLPERGGIYDEYIFDHTAIAESNDIGVTQNKPTYDKNAFIMDMEKLIKAKREHGSISMNTFLKSNYDLTDSVHNWSDYLVQRLHPRSITLIPHQRQTDDDTSFNCYTNGTEVWENIGFRELYTDKLQNYLEECDSLQGFQTITDVSDGFSGLSVRVLEYLRDEYNKKTVFTFVPFCENVSTSSGNVDFRGANIGFAMGHIVDYSDLILPISMYDGVSKFSSLRQLKDIQLTGNNKYQHSAVLAAALDTISIPYRLRSNDFSMHDYCSQLCPLGRKMCSASVCLPFPLRQKEFLLPLLERWEGPLLNSLTPCIDFNMSDNTVQYINSKGIKDNKLKPETGILDSSNQAYTCTRADQMIELFCKFSTNHTLTMSVSTQETFRVPVTFPNILNGDYNLVGQNSENTIGRLSEYVMLAGIHNSGTMKNYIDAVRGECIDKKIKPVRPHIENDEFLIALEMLNTFGELFTENWSI